MISEQSMSLQRMDFSDSFNSPCPLPEIDLNLPSLNNQANPTDIDDQEYYFNKILTEDSQKNKEWLFSKEPNITFEEYLRTLFQSCLSDWNRFSNEDDEIMKLLYSQLITSSNYSKNVVKAFQNYLTTNKSDKLVIECLDPNNGTKAEVIKQYKRYMQPKSINNNQLKKLIENKRFNPHFLYFLKYYAFDYLNNSKSENRYHHMFYVLFLIRCYFNKANLQALIAYKKQKLKKDF